MSSQQGIKRSEHGDNHTHYPSTEGKAVENYKQDKNIDAQGKVVQVHQKGSDGRGNSQNDVNRKHYNGNSLGVGNNKSSTYGDHRGSTSQSGTHTPSDTPNTQNLSPKDGRKGMVGIRQDIHESNSQYQHSIRDIKVKSNDGTYVQQKSSLNQGNTGPSNYSIKKTNSIDDGSPQDALNDKNNHNNLNSSVINTSPSILDQPLELSVIIGSNEDECSDTPSSLHQPASSSLEYTTENHHYKSNQQYTPRSHEYNARLQHTEVKGSKPNYTPQRQQKQRLYSPRPSRAPQHHHTIGYHGGYPYEHSSAYSPSDYGERPPQQHVDPRREGRSHQPHQHQAMTMMHGEDYGYVRHSAHGDEYYHDPAHVRPANGAVPPTYTPYQQPPPPPPPQQQQQQQQQQLHGYRDRGVSPRSQMSVNYHSTQQYQHHPQHHTYPHNAPTRDQEGYHPYTTPSVPHTVSNSTAPSIPGNTRDVAQGYHLHAVHSPSHHHHHHHHQQQLIVHSPRQQQYHGYGRIAPPQHAPYSPQPHPSSTHQYGYGVHHSYYPSQQHQHYIASPRTRRSHTHIDLGGAIPPTYHPSGDVSMNASSFARPNYPPQLLPQQHPHPHPHPQPQQQQAYTQHPPIPSPQFSQPHLDGTKDSGILLKEIQDRFPLPLGDCSTTLGGLDAERLEICRNVLDTNLGYNHVACLNDWAMPMYLSGTDLVVVLPTLSFLYDKVSYPMAYLHASKHNNIRPPRPRHHQQAKKDNQGGQTGDSTRKYSHSGDDNSNDNGNDNDGSDGDNDDDSDDNDNTDDVPPSQHVGPQGDHVNVDNECQDVGDVPKALDAKDVPPPPSSSSSSSLEKKTTQRQQQSTAKKRRSTRGHRLRSSDATPAPNQLLPFSLILVSDYKVGARLESAVLSQYSTSFQGFYPNNPTDHPPGSTVIGNTDGHSGDSDIAALDMQRTIIEMFPPGNVPQIVRFVNRCDLDAIFTEAGRPDIMPSARKNDVSPQEQTTPPASSLLTPNSDNGGDISTGMVSSGNDVSDNVCHQDATPTAPTPTQAPSEDNTEERDPAISGTRAPNIVPILIVTPHDLRTLLDSMIVTLKHVHCVTVYLDYAKFPRINNNMHNNNNSPTSSHQQPQQQPKSLVMSNLNDGFLGDRIVKTIERIRSIFMEYDMPKASLRRSFLFYSHSQHTIRPISREINRLGLLYCQSMTFHRSHSSLYQSQYTDEERCHHRLSARQRRQLARSSAKSINRRRDDSTQASTAAISSTSHE